MDLIQTHFELRFQFFKYIGYIYSSSYIPACLSCFYMHINSVLQQWMGSCLRVVWVLSSFKEWLEHTQVGYKTS